MNGYKEKLIYQHVHQQFNIVVEGIRGTSYTGDIALDDFRFEQCYENPPSPTCQQASRDPNQFMCQSKHCIPKIIYVIMN